MVANCEGFVVNRIETQELGVCKLTCSFPLQRPQQEGPRPRQARPLLQLRSLHS